MNSSLSKGTRIKAKPSFFGFLADDEADQSWVTEINKNSCESFWGSMNRSVVSAVAKNKCCFRIPQPTVDWRLWITVFGGGFSSTRRRGIYAIIALIAALKLFVDKERDSSRANFRPVKQWTVNVNKQTNNSAGEKTDLKAWQLISTFTFDFQERFAIFGPFVRADQKWHENSRLSSKERPGKKISLSMRSPEDDDVFCFRR